MRVLFLVALGVAGYLLWKLYLRQLLKQGRSGQIKVGLVAMGFVFLALAVTGRAPALFAVLGALMTQAIRFGPLIARFAPSLSKHFGVGNPFTPGASTPGTSQVRTPTILMSLEHGSGQMDGEVLAGAFSGRMLSALCASELVQLHAYCRKADPEALRLLEAYVARERATEFENAEDLGTAGEHADASGAYREDDGSSRRSTARGGADMNVTEAADILGVEPDADRDAVMAAHRTLMTRLHPDKGGNDYLATKVNAARTVLLEALTRSGS